MKLTFNILLSFLLFSTSLFADNPMLGCLIKGENYKCLIETKKIIEPSSCGSCCPQVSVCDSEDEPEIFTCDLSTERSFKDQCICSTVRHIQIANLPNETKILTSQYIQHYLQTLETKSLNRDINRCKQNLHLEKIHTSISSTVLLM